ncbi:MAG: C40 family peptidase [Bacteroidia bacterium]|nr:C40 family peptidase [Bacteroidia bacterium]
MADWLWIPKGVVPLRREPTHRSEMVSQILWGEPQQILQEEKGWVFVRGWVDGYVGWVPAGSLIAAWREGGGWAVVKRKWAPLFQVGKLVGYIPVGSLWPASGIWRTAVGEFTTTASALLPWPSPALTVIPYQVYRLFRGAPYLWGGKTPAGVDCSGLTQIAYRLAGRLLSRDAYQQAEETFPIAAPSKGSLVFFTDSPAPSSRISHVGLYWGGGRLLHATPANGVHITPYKLLFTHTFHSIRAQIEVDFVI